MKKLIIAVCFIFGMGLAIALDLSSKGTYRLWKEAENHVKVQRIITDPNGVLTVIWERSYGIDEVTRQLAQAQTKPAFWNNGDAVQYIAAQKVKTKTEIDRWQAIKNKFVAQIDN